MQAGSSTDFLDGPTVSYSLLRRSMGQDSTHHVRFRYQCFLLDLSMDEFCLKLSTYNAIFVSSLSIATIPSSPNPAPMHSRGDFPTSTPAYRRRTRRDRLPALHPSWAAGSTWVVNDGLSYHAQRIAKRRFTYQATSFKRVPSFFR